MIPSSTRDMRAFALIAETGSMTRACQLMGESSGSISRRITRLEHEVGLLLLHRTTRSVSLTEEGSTYLPKVQQALELLDQTDVMADDLSGVLRVCSSPGFGLRFLPLVLGRLSLQYPRLHAEVTLSDASPNFSLGFDVAILPATRRLRDSALISRRIRDWTNILVASPRYLAERSAPTHPDELVSHQLLFAGEQAREEIDIDFVPEGADPVSVCLKPSISSHDVNFIREACLSGAGIAFLPDLLVAQDVHAGRLVSVLVGYRSDSFAGRLHCLYRKTKGTSARIGAFLNVLSGHGDPLISSAPQLTGSDP